MIQLSLLSYFAPFNDFSLSLSPFIQTINGVPFKSLNGANGTVFILGLKESVIISLNCTDVNVTNIAIMSDPPGISASYDIITYMKNVAVISQKLFTAIVEGSFSEVLSQYSPLLSGARANVTPTVVDLSPIPLVPLQHLPLHRTCYVLLTQLPTRTMSHVHSKLFSRNDSDHQSTSFAGVSHYQWCL
jgi:hypothetical protein